MLRHAARPTFRHVSSTFYRAGATSVSESHAMPFQTGRQQRLNSGPPKPQISPYISAAGRVNGIYMPDRKLYRHLAIPSQAVGYTMRMTLYKSHIWRTNYHPQLTGPSTQRELIMIKHFEDRDKPLWITTRVMVAGFTKGIVRSKAAKRMRNAMREALLRAGYSPQGRRIGEGVSVEEHKKGPVLWGNIELITNHPVEVATADFQEMVGFLGKLMPSIINHLRLKSTVGLGPGNYPTPTREESRGGAYGRDQYRGGYSRNQDRGGAFNRVQHRNRGFDQGQPGDGVSSRDRHRDGDFNWNQHGHGGTSQSQSRDGGPSRDQYRDSGGQAGHPPKQYNRNQGGSKRYTDGGGGGEAQRWKREPKNEWRK